MKQKGWSSERIWWVPVLAKGKLHVEVLGEEFPCEEPAGAAMFAVAVNRSLAKRFQAGTPKPGVLFLDRGRGWFNPTTGRVTRELASALDPTDLNLFWGDDAHEQPGYCADVLLHETTVAWIRKGLNTSVPKPPWKRAENSTASAFGMLFQLSATTTMWKVFAERYLVVWTHSKSAMETD